MSVAGVRAHVSRLGAYSVGSVHIQSVRCISSRFETWPLGWSSAAPLRAGCERSHGDAARQALAVPGDFGRARPAVVGAGHRRAIGADHADRDQIAALRAAGSRPTPSVSVDLQIGPSTRTWVVSGAPSSIGRPREVSARMGWTAPYRAGTDQLGHARVEHDDRCLARAHVEHATDQPATAGDDGTARFDRQPAGRVPSGIASSSACAAWAKRAGERHRRRRRSWRRESRRRHRACRNRAAWRAAARADEGRSGTPIARHRWHRAASRRGGGCRASAAGRRGRRRPR